MIGSVLDKYEVLQKLGEGATATVYRGRHLTIGKDVAIKVLHPHLSASSRYRERFNREARAVGRLSHQNIVSILDYSGQGADDCYIVTELVDGVTILGLIQDRGRLPSEIAALAGADLASALSFAHKEGVIHRDIKPENVMIRRDGRVKLMDFGVARVLDESSITLDGSLLGSPAYMSPQQALDEPLDGRSDLFSLGTVLFHAVTGHVPFAGGNASVILKNIIDGNRPEVLELAPQASPALAGVIDRLLQPRPEDRYATAEDARVALLACLEEVRLTPDHPSINLRSYLVDPEACEAALDAVLRPTLLEVGKERLGRGDTLGALQLFNRLLAIDEDNAEVITLIQSLHQAPTPKGRGRGVAFAALAAVTLLAGGGAGWWLWGRGDAQTVEVPAPDAEPVALASAPAPTGPAVPQEPGPAGPSAPVAASAALPGAPPASLPVVGRPEPSPPPITRDEPRQAARLEPVARTVAEEKPAEIVLDLGPHRLGEAEVWVDGVMVGYRTGGGRGVAKWIGTTTRPLQVTGGTHVVELRNSFYEPARVEITLSPGERKEIQPPLRRLQVEFIINSQIPNDCKLTIGEKPYDPLSAFRSLKLRDPDANTPVVFNCPEPIGTIATTLGETKPGQTYFLPARVGP